MRRSFRSLILLLALTLPSLSAATLAAPETHPGQRAFARELAREVAATHPTLTRRQIDATLATAKFQQSIIDAISRPAEAKPWKDYRPIFLTEKRIADGIAFYRANQATLERITAETGVPATLIVAIIGVETNYGRITGKYRVLDALVTLAFYYPPRAEFFRGELKQLFLMQRPEVPFPLEELTGSYAGAMGWGQFIPTSYNKYARDGDGDARIDLWTSTADILTSVANYFVTFGWQADRPVALPAHAAADARVVQAANSEPVYSLGQLAEWGYNSNATLDAQTPATLLTLEGANGPEQWITFGNFWVITRYNRSPLYSLAVWQLAQSVGSGVSESAP